jgi:hypothetical protein
MLERKMGLHDSQTSVLEKSMAVDDTALEETSKGANETGTTEASEPQYLHGLQLGLVTTCITMVCFLTLLDTSIVATVSNQLNPQTDGHLGRACS